MNITHEDREFLKSLTLLYVEDEADTRQQTALFLKRHTGSVVTADNGREIGRAHV
jgi:CheY-like chemotaxis protein